MKVSPGAGISVLPETCSTFPSTSGLHAVASTQAPASANAPATRGAPRMLLLARRGGGRADRRGGGW
jgi:hypothetical protein